MVFATITILTAAVLLFEVHTLRIIPFISSTVCFRSETHAPPPLSNPNFPLQRSWNQKQAQLFNHSIITHIARPRGGERAGSARPDPSSTLYLGPSVWVSFRGNPNTRPWVGGWVTTRPITKSVLGTPPPPGWSRPPAPRGVRGDVPNGVPRRLQPRGQLRRGRRPGDPFPSSLFRRVFR